MRFIKAVVGREPVVVGQPNCRFLASLGVTTQWLVRADDQRPQADSLIKRSSAAERRVFALERLLRNFRRLFSGGEETLFVSANAFVGVQAFEHKFCRRDLCLRALLR